MMQQGYLIISVIMQLVNGSVYKSRTSNDFEDINIHHPVINYISVYYKCTFYLWPFSMGIKD